MVMRAFRHSSARAVPASPLVVSNQLLTLAQSASAHGRRQAAVVLLAAALAVLEAPKRQPAQQLARSRAKAVPPLLPGVASRA